MALVEKYHVVASVYDVDSSTLDIKEGMFVALTANGVRRVTTGDDGKVLGVAGDTKSDSASAMPGVGTGYISGGNTVNFQNRVSDYFDETKASGRITIYSGGGEFATDQWTTVVAGDIGKFLKVDEATGTLTLDGTAKTADTVAMLTGAPGSYPSGVPGVDINGDIALGGDNSNQYIEFKLLV
jgi:hypothetical protein